MKHVTSGFAVVLFAAVALAGPSVRTTKITFSQSVRVPGATLSPGTYYFTTPNPNNRTLVRVEDENRQPITQFMGIGDYLQHTDHTMIVFGDHECGPKAIKLWSYPGKTPAIRFVYPEDEAALIAASCKELVPETDVKVGDGAAPTGSNSNVSLMSPQKHKEPYKPESLSASDQADRDGFDSDPQ